MRSRLLVVGLLVVLAGCGGRKVVPVSGRLTLDDKPVANATVIFEPISEELNPGPGSQGKTNSNGEFTLTLMTGERSGAHVGKHTIRITAYEGDDKEVPSSGSDMVFRKRTIPEEYASGGKLTYEVPAGGTNQANFDLKTPSK
jgi:hypothetical protein